MKPTFLAFALLSIGLLAIPLAACTGHEPAVRPTDIDESHDDGSSPTGSDDSSTPDPDPGGETPAPGSSCKHSVRVMTFNVSLYRDRQGELLEDLRTGDAQAETAATVIATLDPDILFLNEFDYDDEGEALGVFNRRYVDATAVSAFPHAAAFSSNTGLPSGLDLNRDGVVTEAPGTDAYAGDAWGYGKFPGQYAFALLSRFPIDEAELRSFQTLRWSALPDHVLPIEYYGEAIASTLRLSSKNHVDAPVVIGGRSLHMLLSHPTPPSFDGPEDRNGRRNLDEVRFWHRYVSGEDADWACDDGGTCAGLQSDADFVIVGDLNSDPNDGDAVEPSGVRAARVLLDNPRIASTPVPSSPGGVEQARLQGMANDRHRGDPAHDTADFNDRAVGNLRTDYVLPSSTLTICDSGVFWPLADDPLFPLVGTFPFPVSDHRAVWVDVAFSDGE